MNWTVTKFIEQHNHPLVTKKDMYLLRSHRNISNMHDCLIKNPTNAGVKTVHAYNILVAG
ncbi:hypothetical protein KSP40_PGU011151 [Platanthera guangdongensis]|uniref:Protein FAR1-RELATED SEQUENCE n=1 Tax=Platanthera guangdongensis TaxID=2320717 RepID=A0ABR2MN54_9ASPA